MTRVALCFPGQGSQAAGMARGLLGVELAGRLLAAASDAGCDLATALDGDAASLRPTEIAQPALLLVSCVVGEAVAGQPGVEVVGVAGHSVGEYAALVAAGALEAEVAMGLVVARGRAMGAMREGAMLALLGASEADATALCEAAEAEGLGPLVIANLNAPGQIVLSGSLAGVERAASLARDRGVRRAMRLNVSGAFHSPLMADAASGFGEALDAAELRDPRVPVAANVDGELVSSAAALRERLRRQLVSPVRWTACVVALGTLRPDLLVEAGPGNVLTALARRIVPDLPAVAVEGLEAAASVAGAGVGPARG